jgi:hypothetical protein
VRQPVLPGQLQPALIASGIVKDVLVNVEAAERSGDRFVMRNGGALFFAKNVKHFFPQA